MIIAQASTRKGNEVLCERREIFRGGGRLACVCAGKRPLSTFLQRGGIGLQEGGRPVLAVDPGRCEF